MSMDNAEFRIVAVHCTPSPRDVHGLIPRACDYITLHGKRDSGDVVKGSI